MVPITDPTKNLRDSLIRTLVPIIVGPIVSWLIRQGLDIDQAEVTAWLTPIVTAAWYIVPRLLEQRFPQFGWLLGMAKQPAYAPADAPPAQPAPGELPEGAIVYVNDDKAHPVDAAVMVELPGDHEVPLELLQLHERLEELGMTPAAFAAMFPEGRK